MFKTAKMIGLIGASYILVSASQGQAVLRAMADNRSGNASAFANAPSGDPRESGYNVDPGENEYEPFDFILNESDTRQGCSGTNANGTVDHQSDFINIDGQQRCRGFRAFTDASSRTTVNSCGAGNTTFGNFGDNINVVMRIESAPPAGVPIRVRGRIATTGGATGQLRIVRPNGTHLLNLSNGSVNQVVNLPNGDYTLMCSTANGMSSRSTIGTSSKSAEYSFGFWKECAGDIDGSGQINLEDLALVLASFGTDNGGDVNGDGQTTLADLAIVLGNFGDTCP
jgi:hypothetical protein